MSCTAPARSSCRRGQRFTGCWTSCRRADTRSGRRSPAGAQREPAGVFTATAAARPGEQVQMDATALDVMAVMDDGVLGRPELVLSVDIATRTICSAVLRPVGAKAVDAALLLARMLVPEPMRPGWADALAMSASRDPARSGWSRSTRGWRSRRPGRSSSRTRSSSTTARCSCPRRSCGPARAGHLGAAGRPADPDRQVRRGAHVRVDEHAVLPAPGRLYGPERDRAAGAESPSRPSGRARPAGAVGRVGGRAGRTGRTRGCATRCSRAGRCPPTRSTPRWSRPRATFRSR